MEMETILRFVAKLKAHIKATPNCATTENPWVGSTEGGFNIVEEFDLDKLNAEIDKFTLEFVTANQKGNPQC